MVLSCTCTAHKKGPSDIHTNFFAGDLGVAIKSMVDEFQAASKSNQNIQSIADMQRFIENYPEFRAKSGNVSKHVTIMGELGRLIDERHLMQVSQVEQVCRLHAPYPQMQ